MVLLSLPSHLFLGCLQQRDRKLLVAATANHHDVLCLSCQISLARLTTNVPTPLTPGVRLRPRQSHLGARQGFGDGGERPRPHARGGHPPYRRRRRGRQDRHHPREREGGAPALRLQERRRARPRPGDGRLRGEGRWLSGRVLPAVAAGSSAVVVS